MKSQSDKIIKCSRHNKKKQVGQWNSTPTTGINRKIK